MKLKEFEGKEIFKHYHIPVPRSFLVRSPKDLRIILSPVMVKAQILSGKRKIGGGIKPATPKTLKKVASSMLKRTIYGHKVTEVLVEEQIPIDKEYYVALIVDGSKRCIKCVVSLHGGIDIEALAQSHPKLIKSFPFTASSLKSDLKRRKLPLTLAPIIKNLSHIMHHYDCDLVEINPLVLSKKKLVAADSKITIDDNSLYRQPEFHKKSELTQIEEKASSYGLQYVDLDGNISVIGDGAGLVMATLDILAHYGGKAADFLDVGGGASVKKMEKAMEMLLMKKTKGIFINIFGGITRCDEIAKGIILYMKKKRIKIPMVVRMTGTNDKLAKKMLNDNGISSFDSMEECAKKIVSLVR